MRGSLPAVLSLTAGYADTSGFLALKGLFTSRVTGNFVTWAPHWYWAPAARLRRLLPCRPSASPAPHQAYRTSPASRGAAGTAQRAHTAARVADRCGGPRGLGGAVSRSRCRPCARPRDDPRDSDGAAKCRSSGPSVSYAAVDRDDSHDDADHARLGRHAAWPTAGEGRGRPHAVEGNDCERRAVRRRLRARRSPVRIIQQAELADSCGERRPCPRFEFPDGSLASSSCCPDSSAPRPSPWTCVWTTSELGQAPSALCAQASPGLIRERLCSTRQTMVPLL
jgi:hypothetical protein